MIRRRWMALPKLLRFMLTHIANGMALGSAFLLGMIWFDLLGIGTLLTKDKTGLATAVLFFQTSMTFGAVAMAVAVMNLGERED